MSDGIRQAIRQLRRRPAFCAAVVTIMALTVGSSTAIFSIVSAALLPQWPYLETERLAIVWHSQGTAPGVVGLSPGDYAVYRDTSQAFESVAALSTRGFNVSGGGGEGEPARVTCARATAGLFPMLGVPVEQGRWFTADEDRDASRVIVLNHTLWQSQFGGDNQLIGRSIVVDATPYVVVGIMPESFSFPPPGVQGTTEAACWVPASFTPAELSTPGFDFVVVVKRKAGVAFERAAADADAGARRIWESYPAAVQSQIQLRARLVPLIDQVTARIRTPLLMFTASVLLLLLIGCANVSNLLLTQLQIRQREMRLRAALGATRRVLIRQLLAESVLLAVAGGLGGVMLANVILAIVVPLGVASVPQLAQARVDLTTLAFALGCAVCAGIVGSVAPAFRSQGADGAVRDDERTMAGIDGDWLRTASVVTEIALAVVVLTAAALLTRSVVKVNGVSPGFEPTGVVTFSIALPQAKYGQPALIDRFAAAMVERLGAVRGATDVAAGSSLPIGATDVGVVSPRNAPPGSPPYRPAAMVTITARYFDALGIALQQGRRFEPTDTSTGEPVAIVNETLARTYWQDAHVVGRTMLQVGGTRPLTIVGVVADVRQGGLDRAPVPTVYVPMAQALGPARTLAFVVDSGAAVGDLAPQVRRIVAEADDTLPVFALRTGDDLVSASVAGRRFNMRVVGVFAAIALGLAGFGLYAVIAFHVAQSSREFGVRMAVGATLSRIVGLVVGRAVRLLVAGIGAGCVLAAGLGQFVASLLFAIEPTDAASFGLAAVLVGVVSAAAVAVPAIRAARVDVVACLRRD